MSPSVWQRARVSPIVVACWVADVQLRIGKRDRKAIDYSAAKRTVEAAREKGGPKAVAVLS